MSKLKERRREIRAMTEQQAHEELARLRDELFRLRLQLKRGEVKNNRQFPQLKKEVARLLQHIGELNNAALVASEETPEVALAESEEPEELEKPEEDEDE